MDFRRKHIDLVGKMNLWFGISLALILVGMASWALFGLNLGIDFKGGGQFQYRIPYSLRPQAGQEAAFQDKASTALQAQGIDTKPQIADGDILVIQTDAKGQSELTGQEARVRRALTTLFAGGKTHNGEAATLTPLSQQFVGPVIGDELKRNAITGVCLGVALIALWIYIRYNFAGDGTRYAVAGVAALIHDVLVLVGMFALIGHLDRRVEIESAFIAALLTVVGYSINDSVVIFDRLRENLRLRRKEPFEKVVNDSLLETMSRSINTGLTVLIMLFALLLLGGESIYNFVLAMLVGIASGLYSSIFNASMVLVAWHRWDEKKAARARATGAFPALATPRSSTRLATPNRVPTAAISAASVPTARRNSFASTTLPAIAPSTTLLSTRSSSMPDSPATLPESTATITTISSETVPVPIGSALASAPAEDISTSENSLPMGETNVPIDATPVSDSELPLDDEMDGATSENADASDANSRADKDRSLAARTRVKSRARRRF